MQDPGVAVELKTILSWPYNPVYTNIFKRVQREDWASVGGHAKIERKIPLEGSTFSCLVDAGRGEKMGP